MSAVLQAGTRIIVADFLAGVACLTEIAGWRHPRLMIEPRAWLGLAC